MSKKGDVEERENIYGYIKKKKEKKKEKKEKNGCVWGGVLVCFECHMREMEMEIDGERETSLS